MNPKIASQILYKPENSGFVPATVTQVVSGTTVNLCAFVQDTDSHIIDTRLVESVPYDDAGGAGTWCWPEDVA